jgi:hypothetical protein
MKKFFFRLPGITMYSFVVFAILVPLFSSIFVSCKKPKVNYVPTISTTEITDITSTTALAGGVISDSGGTDITASGVTYGTSPRPAIAGNHTTDGTTSGAFTSGLTGLTANTTYYVRAYATNSVGTAYGDEVSFTTLP